MGPFIAAHFPLAALPAAVYERLLCRLASGYIGWTPYLCGRALTFGAARAVTAPGWPLGDPVEADIESLKPAARERFGISRDAIVIGLAGSLVWNSHRRYCYGLELVKCARLLRRKDIVFLIVGEGSGLPRLREMAGQLLGTRVILPGAVSLNEVLPSLAAMDVGSLPQSMDGVGAFRYTTKIAEYIDARLPVITSRVPMAYDLGQNWMWRLPGAGPWSNTYVEALTALIETFDHDKIAAKRDAIPRQFTAFESTGQIERITVFLKEMLEEKETLRLR